ncbi:MAG: sporulation peptidase YabG [Clostridiaceae bacterium]
MKIGDVVVRKSYNKDVTFKIIDIKENGDDVICTIKGINLRLVADSPILDLELVAQNNLSSKEVEINKKISSSVRKLLMNRTDNKNNQFRGLREKIDSNLTFGRPGRVLHIDGDAQYLTQCLNLYKQLSIEAFGKVIKESEQSSFVVDLVKNIRPDIVVLTGHDATLKGTVDFMKVESYKNSKYFIEAVEKIREYEPDYDDLVIYAGACQSYYEAILDAGANFASSPNRVLIHCLDPVFLCEKIAYTSVENTVSIKEAIENTITGTKGIGGLQTRGKYREGYPKSSYI